MQNAEGSRMYVVRDVPGKGNGLVAIETIPKGTRILCEEPIITVSESMGSDQLLASISQQVDSLSEQQRQIFLSMHSVYPPWHKTPAERYLGIIYTVPLPIEDADGNEIAGVFLEASRINHACDNNAQKHWNSNIRRHTVHALRDIQKGEEITIYYLGADMKREARRAALKCKLGFDCLCRLCSLPLAQSQESDKRLERVRRLDDLISQGGLKGILTSPLQTLRYAEEIVRLYNEQGPDDAGLPRAYFDAAQICIANGDLARGRVFVERAVAGWQISYGADSKEVIENKAFVRDPSKHPLYALNVTWQTAAEDVPRGLDQDSFEDWVWRREKPEPAGAPGVLSTLRLRTAFPSFPSLPDDKNLDLTFYERKEAGVYVPRRHWCILAEIVGFFTLARLQIELKDVDGTRFHLNDLICYTPDHGEKLDHALVKKGNTVAVLYAQRHTFLYEPRPGIRHEDPDKLKIFPASLDTLLALSDQFQQFSTVQDGVRTCHGCGKKGTPMKTCARCLSFSYCSKACQETGWKVKGHKTTCKLLKDPDVRGLFTLEWDKFEDYAKFPLAT